MSEHEGRSLRIEGSYWLHGDDDRYCPYCGEVALLFDPTTGGQQCRGCGKRV